MAADPLPTSAGRQPSVPELNGLSADAFVAALAPLFEGAPGFLHLVCDARPFVTADDLFDRARATAVAAPEAIQIELVDAHPRLGASVAGMSGLSLHEQGYRDQTPRMSTPMPGHDGVDSVEAELQELNDAYEARFGFRYCVFVAGRPRAALLPGFREALGSDRDAELRRAVTDAVAIARDRYRRLSSQEEAT